jgi:ATP/maltotriose-dependent transcriptional regulator MalT
LKRKLTLISAQAGAGKSSLLAQWLEECRKPSAWLSLEKHGNDRTVFLRYLCTAIGGVFPGACRTTLVSEPIDQAGLIGMINHVNMLGLPLVSVECVSAPEKNGPSIEGKA